MSFGSFGASFGSFGAGVGGLSPSFTNITSWLKAPTTDGKTLANSKGTDANLTGVNCLEFDGTNDQVNLADGGGVIANGSAFEVEVTAAAIANLPTNGTDPTNLLFQGTYGSSSGVIQCALRGGSTYKGMLFRLGNGSGGYNELTPDSDQTSTINDNQFHTFKYTFDGNDTMKIFLDGTLVGTKTSLTSPTFSSTSANKIMNDVSSNFGVNTRISRHITTVNGSVFRQLPMAEGSGTKTYDVSGNGHYGTISGATWTTQNSIESWNHEYGFDIDGSVKVPALNTRTKQVATFDGVADEVDTGYTPQGGNLVIDARIKADTVTDQKTLYGVNGNSGFWFRISNGEWQLYSRNAYIFTTSTGIDPEVGNIYDTRVEYDYSSGDWTAKVKLSTDSTYTTVGSGNRLPPLIQGASVILGQKGGTQFFDGEYYSFKLSDGGAKVEYDFQSDIGTTTVQDTTANNNDGTVTVGSGGTATFWGQRVADTSGSLVSADYATGNTTISNPGGFVHNGSECGVDMVTNDLTSTQLFAINNATATQTFVRKDNGNIVQILDYSSALTGNDLTRTRNYVG
jgi:hypothetical protein